MDWRKRNNFAGEITNTFFAVPLLLRLAPFLYALYAKPAATSTQSCLIV